MLQNAQFCRESRREYRCETCDYYTSKRGDWHKHLETKKHKSREMLQNATDIVANNSPKIWRCECGKIYKHHTSFYRHKNRCMLRDIAETTPEKTVEKTVEKTATSMEGMKDLVVSMVEENRELRAILLEQRNNWQNLSHMYITNNINTFNLQVFLLEDCKEALNMTGFKSLNIHVQT